MQLIASRSINREQKNGIKCIGKGEKYTCEVNKSYRRKNKKKKYTFNNEKYWDRDSFFPSFFFPYLLLSFTIIIVNIINKLWMISINNNNDCHNKKKNMSVDIILRRIRSFFWTTFFRLLIYTLKYSCYIMKIDITYMQSNSY